jgi:excisionase family DNA binding protein
MDDNALAFDIKSACRLSGLGRTTLYAAIKIGALSARKCGRRTLVLAADLQAFLKQLPTVHEQPRPKSGEG